MYSIYIVYIIIVYICIYHVYMSIYIYYVYNIYIWKPPANEVNMGIHYGYCNVINDDISMII